MKPDQKGTTPPGHKDTHQVSVATAEQRSHQQAFGQAPGRANDHARDGKERRTSSPHNR